MQVVRVSGTIKKSEEEAIRRARLAILKAKKEAAGSATNGLNAILSEPGLDAGVTLLGHRNGEAPASGDGDDEEEEVRGSSDEHD